MKFERDFLRYFEQVEAGDIVVCDKVAKAVMRALAEIRNPGQWHYSEAMAAKHIDFMQKFCYTAVGSAPKPIAFEPFQLSIIAHAYGMVDDRNLRKVFEELWMMGRKNGKTTVGAALEVDAEYNDGEYAPHIYNADVWKTSGHYGFYKENMYFFNINEGTDEDPRLTEYAVKPMNCPGHVMLYKSELHSYRDLPLRYFEFGTVYRHEMSGVVHGLLRARGFTQDDAHIFCTKDQVVDEVVAILELVDHIMSTFGFQYEAEISTRPEKSIGTDDMWEHATNALKEACARHELAYDINEGDGAFYGPKIDIKVKDAIGRTWQCSTVQIDFNMPMRFGLTYRTEDNTEERPWMLHRAIFGSIERFLGILIEHYAGALPLWLAPVQVAVIPIADRHKEAAAEFAGELKAVGGRVEVMDQNEPMKVKIAKAQSQKIPYMIVMGDKEVEEKLVSVRERSEGDLGQWDRQKFIDVIRDAAI